MPGPVAAAIMGWQGLSTLAHAGEETPEQQRARLENTPNPFSKWTLEQKQAAAGKVPASKGSGTVIGGQTGIGNAAARAVAGGPAGGGSAPAPYTPHPSPLSVPMPDSSGATDYSSMLGLTHTPVATPNASVLAQYSTPSAEERENQAHVSDMARLLGGQGRSMYDVSNPTYRRAMDYYGGILSGNKANIAQAIAPEAEALAEINAGQQKGIEQGSLRGGARDTALDESGRQAAGRISALVPQARKDAAAAGSQLALSGMSLGTQQEGASAGLYSGLAGQQQQSREFGIQAEMQNRFQAAGLDVQEKQLQLSAMLGMRGLDLQQMGLAINEKLQSRGLDIQEMTSMNSLALQKELGLAGIKLSQQQVDLLKERMKNEAASAKGAAWADAGNIFLTGLGMILPSGKSGGGPQQLPINPAGAGLNVLAGGR